QLSGTDAVSVPVEHSDGDRVGVHLVRGSGVVSDVRERAARVGHHADERSAHWWADHVDSGRAVLLHGDLRRILPLAAAGRRGDDGGSAGGLERTAVTLSERSDRRIYRLVFAV